MSKCIYETMDRILDILRNARTTLFLGAGCSMSVGGPSGSELLSRVVNNFSNVYFTNTNNFFDVCQDIVDSENYSRTDLEKFIRKQLYGIFPCENHYTLFSIPWKCIFTTNYDLTLERSISTKLKNLNIRVVTEDKPEIELKRSDLLYYVKIFGSIDISYGNQGNPILTRTDYTTSYSRRESYYKILAECIREGPVIFLGYSFEDNLVYSMLSELQQTVGPEILKTSYAIFPEDLSEHKKRFFTKNKVIHIKGTFEDFITKIRNGPPIERYQGDYSEKLIHVHSFPIDIPFSIEKPAREDFTFLHSESWADSPQDKKLFFKNEDTTFYPYTNNWDFIREVYSFDGDKNPHKCEMYGKHVKTGLKKHIFQYVNSSLTEDNEIVFLKGIAGCGKSIILKRLAYDWYSSGLPVIFMDPRGLTFDNRQVDSFITFIQEKFSKFNTKNKWPKPRTLIICDRAAIHNRSYLDLFLYLTLHKKPITMVIADRENMLNNINENNYVTYSIPETISIDERTDFRDYLFENDIIESDADLYYLMDNSDINSSFFALMYTIVDESKRPLNKIITDQYRKLNGWPKEAYEYVCLLNYYNIEPNEEMLVRATTNDLSIFKTEVENGQLKKVIFPEKKDWNNIDYRVHHQTIALRTVDLEINDPLLKTKKFIDIFKVINSTSPHEVEKVEEFLIAGIGPNSLEKKIPTNLRKDIFELISSQIDSRSIYHHYALLELIDDKNFDRAEYLLNQALNSSNISNERDENIYTSFGKLYSQKGFFLEDKGLKEEALRTFELAESFFQKGRTKIYRNVYAYHAQINLNIKRAEKEIDDINKIKYYHTALKLCDQGISSLSPFDHEEIIAQEAQIKKSLNDYKGFNEAIEKLTRQYNSSLGYELKSLLLYKDSYDAKNEEEKIAILENAYLAITKGLQMDIDNPSLLAIEAKIGLKLFPEDKDKLYSILKKWYDFSDQMDLKLIYWYGVISFIKGYYMDSKKVFENLKHQTQSLPERNKVKRNHVFLDGNSPKLFRGIITEVSQDENIGFVKCTTIPNLPYELRFLPQKASFTPLKGDHVNFNIFFNMRGAYAHEVRKD